MSRRVDFNDAGHQAALPRSGSRPGRGVSQAPTDGRNFAFLPLLQEGFRARDFGSSGWADWGWAMDLGGCSLQKWSESPLKGAPLLINQGFYLDPGLTLLSVVRKFHMRI